MLVRFFKWFFFSDTTKTKQETPQTVVVSFVDWKTAAAQNAGAELWLALRSLYFWRSFVILAVLGAILQVVPVLRFVIVPVFLIIVFALGCRIHRRGKKCFWRL
jgi:Flp pilus assembly protein TadB